MLVGAKSSVCLLSLGLAVLSIIHVRVLESLSITAELSTSPSILSAFASYVLERRILPHIRVCS